MECNQDAISTKWEEIIEKEVKEWREKSIKAVICRRAWGSAVYHLWMQRNYVKFGNHLISEEKIIQMVCWEVRTRIMRKDNFMSSGENLVLCANWDIPTHVLI
jgi:superfamily II helicase